MLCCRVQYHRHRRRHRHGTRRYALLLALTRYHRRLGGVYGECPQGRCHGVYIQLRQGHSGYAHGCHATQYPCYLRQWRTYGGRTVERRERRPCHGYGEGCRPNGERCRHAGTGRLCLSGLRQLLGHVHGQFHELAHRGHRSLATATKACCQGLSPRATLSSMP